MVHDVEYNDPKAVASALQKATYNSTKVITVITLTIMLCTIMITISTTLNMLLCY